jgi:hypothetical protein
MICEALSDRMPEVAKGLSAWDAEEAAHLASCDECQAEWDLIAPLARAAASRPVPAMDLDRVATLVVTQLSGQGKVLAFPTPGRWMRPLAGLAAAAAVILSFTFLRPDLPDGEVAVAVPMRAPTAIPELDALLEAELEVVLASLTPDQAEEGVLSGGGIPRLGDLTDEELEMLLEPTET